MKKKKSINKEVLANNIKKFNKTYNLLMAITLIVLVILFSAINFLKKDSVYSEVENRNLKQKPTFTIKSFFNGSYSNDFTSYISEQFFGRAQFIAIKSKVQELEGINKINDTYVGKEGQLFEDFKIETEDKTQDKVKVINDFHKENPNINISFLLAPTATSVLKDYLPKNAPVDNEIDYINRVKSKLDTSIKLINPYDELYKNKDNYIYYKTDHHWTTDGAYVAYNVFCNVNGITPKGKNEFDVKIVTDSFYGSLSSKIGIFAKNNDQIKVYIPKSISTIVNYVTEQKKTSSLFDSESLDKKDKYEVFQGGNHPLINIKTNSTENSGKNLLIIKDSYANSMIPFLTQNYGEITVVDLRYYTDSLKELIKSKKITDMLILYNANTFNSDDAIYNLTE